MYTYMYIYIYTYSSIPGHRNCSLDFGRFLALCFRNPLATIWAVSYSFIKRFYVGFPRFHVVFQKNRVGNPTYNREFGRKSASKIALNRDENPT